MHTIPPPDSVISVHSFCFVTTKQEQNEKNELCTSVCYSGNFTKKRLIYSNIVLQCAILSFIIKFLLYAFYGTILKVISRFFVKFPLQHTLVQIHFFDCLILRIKQSKKRRSIYTTSGGGLWCAYIYKLLQIFSVVSNKNRIFISHGIYIICLNVIII